MVVPRTSIDIAVHEVQWCTILAVSGLQQCEIRGPCGLSAAFVDAVTGNRGDVVAGSANKRTVYAQRGVEQDVWKLHNLLSRA